MFVLIVVDDSSLSENVCIVLETNHKDGLGKPYSYFI